MGDDDDSTVVEAVKPSSSLETVVHNELSASLSELGNSIVFFFFFKSHSS